MSFKSSCRLCDSAAGMRVRLGDPNGAGPRVAFCSRCDLPQDFRGYAELPDKLRLALAETR